MQVHFSAILSAALITVLIASSPGCGSTKHSIGTARHAYAVGDLDSAKLTLSKLADGRRRHRYESQLDLAMVELASGDSPAAERRLRSLRDHFDALPKHDSLHDAASLAADDNLRVFQLADYEHVLLRSLLAICSLSGDATDAEAYLLQAQARQAEINSQAVAAAKGDATRQPQVALAPYLRGTLREATLQNYDDAERAFRLVSNIQPDFLPAKEDIERASTGSHSRPGHGVLYVLALVGHGPRLVETVAPTTTASLQIASTLLRTVQKQEENDEHENQKDEIVLPNIASVKVPMVDVPPSAIAAIGVSVEGSMMGATQTLTDVGQLAIEKVESEMPWTIGRAVARRVLKETSVTATSNQLGLTGNAATAFEFAAINAWSGVESADTRCWGLLPRQIQVLRAELPEGEHRIEMLPLSMSGEVFAAPATYRVRIENGRNHYCVVIAPEQVLSIVP